MSIRLTRITSWAESESELRMIRTAVFIAEQGISEELEWDEFDQEATHFLVRDEEGAPIATGRLIRTANPAQVRIGRFAVLPERRGHKVATGLLRFIIAYARSEGVEQIELSAQCSVAELYRKQGFKAEGDVYDEAGIPHIRMVLQVRDLPLLQPFVLALDERVHRFQDLHDYRAHLQGMFAQAREQICILSQDLEPGVLQDRQLVETISGFLRRGAQTQLRVLVHDIRPATQAGHALLRLLQRLPSHCALREVPGWVPADGQIFCIVDREGVVLRHQHPQADGFANYADPATVQKLTAQFDQLWSQSEPSAEARRLDL